MVENGQKVDVVSAYENKTKQNKTLREKEAP